MERGETVVCDGSSGEGGSFFFSGGVDIFCSLQPTIFRVGNLSQYSESLRRCLLQNRAVFGRVYNSSNLGWKRGCK